MTPAKRFLTLFSPDAAIVYNLLGTLRNLFGGPLLAMLIAARLAPETQGFYFTFGSIVGLQVLADLGFGTVIIQFAAHEWAGLKREADGRVSGDTERVSRLAHLTRFAVRWYALGAFALGVVFLTAGTYFLGSEGTAVVNWRAPWFCVAILASVRLALTPFLSVLEGCHQVASVQGYRLWEGTQLVVFSCLCILLGLGLWTLAIVSGASVVSCLVFVFARHGRFYRQMLATRGGGRISWAHELLPMQWRIALSSLAGYVVFQLFTPVMFHYHGAVVAGRMGLTLSLVGATTALAGTWINTRIPLFGTLVAQRRWKELDALAWKAGIASVSTAIVTAGGALVLLVALRRYFPAYADRFLPVGTTALLLGAMVIQMASTTEAVYLRAFRREPLMGISLVTAALTGLSTWQLGMRFGPHAVATGYCAIIGLLSFPACTWLLLRFRRQWQTTISPALCAR